MIKVCMVAYTQYPQDVRIRREAEALVDRGDMVDIVCLREKEESPIESINSVRTFRISLPRYRGSSGAMYLVSYMLFFFAASFKVVSLHIKNHYKIIQVHTMPDFMVFTALVPKLMGAKVILDVHDLMPELYRSKFDLAETHWLVRLLTWVERASVQFADRTIAVHKPHLDALVKHGNPAEKFIILINLPDPKMFLAAPDCVKKDETAFTLIYHGLVEKRHGLELVIRAVNNLRDEIKPLKLIVYGKGDELIRLVELVRDLGLEDRICIHLGFIPMEELIPIIRGADVGVVPILNDSFTRYMLPVKLLEYTGLHIPVICSRTETIQAYFDGSFVQFFTPGSVEELTEQIRFLYRNPQKRKQMSAETDTFNCKYNWPSQKLDYYRLVDGLSKA